MNLLVNPGRNNRQINHLFPREKRYLFLSRYLHLTVLVISLMTVPQKTQSWQIPARVFELQCGINESTARKNASVFLMRSPYIILLDKLKRYLCLSLWGHIYRMRDFLMSTIAIGTAIGRLAIEKTELIRRHFNTGL